MIIERINYDEDVTNDMYNLYINKFNQRPIRQYGGIAQVCKSLNIKGDLGIVKANDKWNNIITTYCKNIGKDNCKIDLSKSPDYFRTYSKFRFPLGNITKEDILKRAKRKGWDKYLYYTWSCWFPTKEGEQCGKCEMCKDRIIPYKS